MGVTMPQLDQLSACPGCGEPLEADDEFCGSCGKHLRTTAPTGAKGPAAPAPPPPPMTARRPASPTAPGGTPPAPAGTAPQAGPATPPGSAPGAPADPRPATTGTPHTGRPAPAQQGTAAPRTGPAAPGQPAATGSGPGAPAAHGAAQPGPNALGAGTGSATSAAGQQPGATGPHPGTPTAPPAPAARQPGTRASQGTTAATPAPAPAPQGANPAAPNPSRPAAASPAQAPAPAPAPAAQAKGSAPANSPSSAAKPASAPAVPAAAPQQPHAPAAPAPQDTGSGRPAGQPAGAADGYTPTEPDFTLPPPQPASGGPRIPSLDPRATAAAATPPPAQTPAPAPADPRAAADPRTRDSRPPTRETNPVLCAVCGTGRVDGDGYCADCGRAQPGQRDHVERALGGVAAVSDLGLRHHRNEDSFTVSATALADGSPAVIAIVCDGVSSSSRPHEASAAASEAAAESLLASLPRGVSGQQAMHDAVLSAARAVADLADPAAEPGQNAPACTLVGAVTAGGILTVGWVGDSRAYWIPAEPGAAPARLTEDDSWAAQMVAAGLLSEAEAMADHRAHAITAWLGADAVEVEPHTASFKPDRPGVVIVCTDGLWNYAESAERLAHLVPATARETPLPTAQHLVRHALESGGHDNVTVAVIPFPVAEAAG
ncbi:magnesium or manganese-dependent protein phosphatase [Streptomyces xiamenensis]|uniref:Magnesium or manganese-dependent protein phosphatase n=1 Tax=Streptomyces xiamenensis TaxID=408015 RepID=A0A0F7CNJ1_9ACTN|nr:magnesium or manganese-dependent protein phosphatase [Streptomyces xiamenensis]